MTPLTKLWKSLADVIRSRVSADSFDRWFSNVSVIAASTDSVTLGVPNPIHQFFIESNYSSLLSSALEEVHGGPRELLLECTQESSQAPVENVENIENELPQAPDRASVAISQRSPSATPAASGMNPSYTFESFIVGANNQFAHAASQAVANSPARTYNPLFIYGGSGLGKTHLLHAIGHEINAAKRNGGKVAYITCERFTNEFIAALQENQLMKFRNKYRKVETLLVDDIQFLAGKERIQEEFFHTFNTLHESRKQIVMTCDRPASEIPGLEGRLISRFEWGQTADLRPPDVETRLAILHKKEKSLGSALPPEVLNFLAERIRTNIRRLEGAFIRVSAYSQLTGRLLTLDVVENLLREILQEEGKQAITIESIQKKVADHYDIRMADMTSKRRPENIAFPRQVAMYLARHLTPASLSSIGEAFGGRDHGTVLHACRTVKNRMEVDSSVRQAVEYLEKTLYR